MILLRVLLLPFTLIYALLTKFRNHLFDIGYLHSFRFETFVINVGNLRVGGTGKTPHVEYLIRLLKNHYKIATLSRGYGRKSKGFLLADNKSTAETLGDEPFQFYTKFAPEVSVAVGEERAEAIPHLLFEKQETQIVLLDDAYQHRTVVPDLNILLTDYHHPFYEDIQLPSGRLREARSGAGRADIIVVSKCPATLSISEMSKITAKVRKYARDTTPVFFTGIRYNQPRPLFQTEREMPQRVLLVSGIANSKTLVKEVKKKYLMERVIDFNDHHRYTEKSIREILKQFEEIKGNDKAVLTTEKDMVKLIAEPLRKLLKGIPVFYMPIEIYFLQGKEVFDQLVFDYVRKKV